MFKCKFCNKEYDNKHKLGGHLTKCLLNPKRQTNIDNWKVSRYGENHTPKRIKNINHTCKFCGDSFATGNVLGAHTITCLLNPKREENIKNQLQSVLNRVGVKQTSSAKAKQKIGIQKAIDEGRWYFHKKPGGVKEVFYIYNLKNEKQFIQGSWEKVVVEFFNNKNINWERNKIGYKYIFENNEHKYFPDFYLPDYDIYIEVKGFQTKKDEAKWRDFPFTLLVIKKNEINNLEEWFSNIAPYLSGQKERPDKP